MGELGDRLRQAREAKGLTLGQVEEITRIRRRYLQALEEEDYGQLPGEVFVRGFLRNYAFALGMDPEEVLTASGRKVPSPIPLMQEQPEQILDEPLTSAPTGQWVMAVVIGVMVVITLGLGGWTILHYFGPRSAGPQATATVQPTPTATKSTLTGGPSTISTSAPTSTPTAEPTTTSTPASGILLRIEATARTWVRVLVDDRLAYEGNLEAGQAQEWTGTQQILLRSGNAGGLRIWYNGREEQPIGGPGEVAEHTWQAGALPEGTGSQLPTLESTPLPVGAPPSSPTPTVPPAAPTANP